MRNSYTKREQEWYPQKNLKKKNTCIEKEEGYMTLFACLLFLAISGLLFLCLDGSRLYQAKARCSMAQTGLGEHLLANYNIPLSTRYHLYFLDPRMSKEKLEEKAEEYYNELFSGSTGLGLFSSPLWNLRTESLDIETFGNMQEKSCEYFIAQIEDYMKYDVTKDLIMKALGNTVKKTDEHNTSIDETVKKLDQNEEVGRDNAQNSADNTLTPSEVAEGQQADQTVQENNPLQKIRNILEYGILGIVADEENLSEQKLSPSLLPFKNQNENKIDVSMNLLKNLGNIKETITKQGIDQLAGDVTSRGALNCYIQKYFNYYKKSPAIENTVLQYEVEYILGGQNSDKENLEYVVNRLVLLRFALNAAYAFSDEELNAQALTLAGLLTGITGTPEFVDAVRYIILAAVNLIESVMDVKDLLNGEKVPFLKNMSNWKTSIHGIVDETEEKEEGMEYKDYILILLTMQSDQEKKCFRMQNLMQINIQQEEPSFQIKECRAGLQIQHGIRTGTGFVLREYLLEQKQKFCY